MKNLLFDGLVEDKINNLLLDNHIIKEYNKNDYILHINDKAEYIGLIKSGSANIIFDDYWGNRTILAQIKENEFFLESFAVLETNNIPLSILSNEKTEVLFIDYKRIMLSDCECKTIFIENLLKMIASKNIILTQKISHISKRTTREKLLSYLSVQSNSMKSSNFTIPFNRQELADYLSIDRSALSRELSTMKEEGLLDFYKNEFKLLIRLK